MEYKINLERKSIKQKQEQIASLSAELKNYPTVALLELTQLPDALFQALRKKITKEGGKVKVLKKPVLMRLLAGVATLKSISEKINKPYALILTSLSPYALNKFFKENRKKRAAKVGEKAPFEIIIPAGDTDIPPGPALSELKSAGINVQIKAGKIAVSKDSVVAKSGEAITDMKVKALQKLGIMPFEVKAQLFFAYDGSYIYKPELLNIDETLHSDIIHALSQGFNFSLNANYPTQQNISLLLLDALKQATNISLNASIYSSNNISMLLSSALRQASTLEKLTANAQK